MRPLIGCLQRRRHQPAALADGTESRTQDDGRTYGGSDGGGHMRKRWVKEVVWWRNAESRERWGSGRRSPDEQGDGALLGIVAWLTKFT